MSPAELAFRASSLLSCVVALVCAGCSAGPVPAVDAGLGVSGAGNGGLAGISGNVGVGASGVSGDVTGAAGNSGAGASGSGVAGEAGSSSSGDAGENQDGGDGLPAHGTGPGDWKAGDYPSDLHGQTYLELKGLPGQGGAARQYKVHVPPGYSPETPMPVVFCFHGLSQNAVMFCVDGAGMVTKSDASDFILIMPNGLQNSWNAGTCCGGALTSMIDDVGFVRALFDEVGKHVNIDLGRVYALGLSNGAYMSYRLACQASDIFVAVAPGAGAIGMNDIGGGTSATGDFAECKPTHPVSVLDMHGTMDPLIAYSLQKPSLERIAKADGCMLTTHAATQPATAGDTKCVSYDGCASGVDVTGCTVTGGGHVWFGDPSCGTGAGAAGCGFVGANSDTLVDTDAAWAFFAAHSR